MAIGDGPYGFSFELSRTAVEAAFEIVRDTVVPAHEKLGRATAVAAPTPTSLAKLRREREVRFRMVAPPRKVGLHYDASVV